MRGPPPAGAALAALLLLSGASPLEAQAGDAAPDPGDTADEGAPLRTAGPLEPVETEGGQPSDTLTLEEALRTALGESPDVRVQRAQRSAAAAARWADWGAFLPTASASMNLSRTSRRTVTFLTPEGFLDRLPQPEEETNKGVSQSLSVGWTLLEGGGRIAEMKAGAAASEAERLRLSEVQRRVVSEVKLAYFEARKQQRLVDIARDQLRNRRRELEQARRRYRIAAVNRADLLGARVEVRQAELNLLEARDVARQARRRLRVVMGRPARTDAADFALREVPSPPDSLSLTATRLVQRAVATHPELRALEAEVDRASSRVWGARAGYLPTIRLGFTHGRTEQFPEQRSLFTFDPSNRSNSFSVSASWELFNGFQRKEQNAQASAELQRARAERARRRLEVRKTVRDLADEVKRRERRLRLLRDQLEIARERLELLSEQYRLGSATFAELQRAIDEVTRAERDVVRERYDHLAAWAELERWAGDVAPGLPSPAAGGGTGTR